MALPYASLWEQFRFQLFFATLMCHEFSHAVYALRSLPFDRGHREPFFDPGRLQQYDCSECGVEFERFMCVLSDAKWSGMGQPRHASYESQFEKPP